MELWAKRRLNPEVPALVPGRRAGWSSGFCRQAVPSAVTGRLGLSALVQKPLSTDAQLPGTPEAESLGTTIYELRKERLPGAELSNFWRNMDKEIGIGLRTRVEKKNLSSELLALNIHSNVRSPAAAEICAKSASVHSDERECPAGLPTASNPKDSRTREKAQFCFWVPEANASSLICPSRHPALLCRVPASPSDGKAWLQRAPGAQHRKAEPHITANRRGVEGDPRGHEC